ncbi:hypothetical protein MAR_026416, partial [Mya arenaria]
FGGHPVTPGPASCNGSNTLCTANDNIGCPKGETCKDGKCCQMTIIARKCKSGKPGPSCSETTPCSDGYYCRHGTCCISRKTTHCPSGPSCSETKPCADGYSCNGGKCCRKTIIARKCKSGKPGPSCSETTPCSDGYYCRHGCSDAKPCLGDQTCIDGHCCPQVTCKHGFTGQTCSKGNQECPSGSTCKAPGKCCRQSPELNRCPMFSPPKEPTDCPPPSSPPACTTDKDCKDGRA